MGPPWHLAVPVAWAVQTCWGRSRGGRGRTSRPTRGSEGSSQPVQLDRARAAQLSASARPKRGCALRKRGLKAGSGR